MKLHTSCGFASVIESAAIVMMATLLGGCAGSSTIPSFRPLPSNPLLSVAWLPPCTEPSAPAFTIDVFADGNVRYIGDHPAKELGERRAHIAVSDVRRLALSARAVANGPG